MRWLVLLHSWARSPTSALKVVSLGEARRAGRAALLILQTQGGEVCHRACDLEAESFFFFFFKVYISLFGFPGDSDGKESACNVGDPGSIPGSGRSPGEGNNNPLQHACLEKYHGWRSLAGYSLGSQSVLGVTKRHN